MLEELPLRELFSAIDINEKGRISITDIQVAIRRAIGQLVTLP